MSFETKAIFALADLLPQLQPSDYYDIAQKLYMDWLEEKLGAGPKLRRLMAVMRRKAESRITHAFHIWRQAGEAGHMRSENAWLKERLDAMIQENEGLRQERLDWQRRSTFHRINPVRSNSKQRRASGSARGSSAKRTARQTYATQPNEDSMSQISQYHQPPVYERLH